jgi:integrase
VAFARVTGGGQAREMGYIEHNPAHGIRKTADKRRSFRLGPKEYRVLGQAIEAARRRGEHWQALSAIRLLALTGCRRSEILNLKWSEVDVKNACLRLGETKTGASIRPLPKPAQAILAHIKRDAEHVFPGVTGGDKPYASVFPKAWRRIVGVAYTPHGLRHAYASAAHELGLSELTIKALLGHARLGVTSGYIMTMDSLLLAAAERVAGNVKGAMTGETGKIVSLPPQPKATSRNRA